MEIYIRTKKNAWKISFKGIQKVKQSDWERIESTFKFLLGLEPNKAKTQQLSYKINEGWVGKNDFRLP